MDITFVTEGRGEALALMAGEGRQLTAAGQALDALSGGRVTRAMGATRFTGAAGQVVDILAPDGVDAARVLVIGVGDLARADGLAVERWAGRAVQRTLTSGAGRLALLADALPNLSAQDVGMHAALGARLAAYRFDSYRTKLKPEQTPTLSEVQVAVEGPAAARARFEQQGAIAQGVAFARDLVSEPANILYPE